MPVSPKFTWEQTDTTLTVEVALLGCSRAKTHVTATEALIKINAPPYLFHIDLAQTVDDTRSRATLRQKGVTFLLYKKDAGYWPKLEVMGDKAAIVQRRNDSISKAHARVEAARLAELQLLEKAAKDATDRQIELDRRKRQLIEDNKAAELASERARLLNWQAKLGHGPGADGDSESEEDEAAAEAIMPDHPDYHGRGWLPPAPLEGLSGSQHAAIDSMSRAEPVAAPSQGITPAHIWEEADETDELQQSDLDADKENKGAHDAATVTFTPLPPPRHTLEPVLIEFTELETEHLPARETREVELRTYKKQYQDDKALADSLSIAERQPVFLKDKGDKLYQAGSYQGAINAYTRALDIDDCMTACYTNRAACYLKLGNFRECVADCTTALRQSEEAVVEDDSEDAQAQRRRSRMRLLVRRAMAHVELGELQQAAAGYEQAIKAEPANLQLQADLAEVHTCMRPAAAAALRQCGDARFRAQDLAGAVEAYTALLQLPDALPADQQAAVANRSAAYLTMGRYEEAVEDCHRAFQLLTGGCRTASAASACGGDSSGMCEYQLHDFVHKLAAKQVTCDDQQQASLLRLLARHGAALGHLKRYQAASRDLKAAAALHRLRGEDSKAAGLEADSAKLQSMHQPVARA
ncbi:hypothetical protein WJX72_004865 [[Myrmecia] bisecta]|uniref:CS domain-containing protein n=1 Tax=[Myrmecia] bisecta TaxID=41462 RepID=A0AAW1R643_9CHLO